MNLLKCPKCKGNVAEIEPNKCWLCKNKECKQLIELVYDKCDTLSWWGWKKHWKKVE